MGKRSSFDRVDKDKYMTTDKRAIPPLLPHLAYTTFMEPCAGDGSLVDLLEGQGLVCTLASDKTPDSPDVECADALLLKEGKAPQIITNPPWSRKELHALIEHFITLDVDTWLLFDAGWAFTEQAEPYLKYCHKIVVTPRLNWIPGTKQTAKDDCAWYLFRSYEGETTFVNQRKTTKQKGD